MPQLKIGIQLASLRQPLKQSMLTAARLGATGVEVDARGELNPQSLSRTGVRQVRKMLDDLNLRVCAVRFRTRRGYDTVQDLDRRLEATRQAMTMAQQLGAPVLINSVGNVSRDSSSPEWGLLLETLSDLGRFGQHVGVFLTAETGAEDPADLRKLIEALPPGALAANLDPGPLVMNGHNPRLAAAELKDHLLHVHASDGVRDGGLRQGVPVPLGRGSVDFPELLGCLEEQGYQGYFTIQREAADNPEYEIGQAVKYLQRL